MGDLDFSHEDVERAARYHRPLYLLVVVRLAVAVGVYSLLAWSWIGDRLWGIVDGAGWAGAAVAWAAVVGLCAELAALPFDLWRLRYERRWEFSRESNAAWSADKAKSSVLSLALAAGIWVAAVALGRALPGWWALPAAAAIALLVVALVFLAPVVFEPLFNRFDPLADEQLAESLRGLAVRAGVPIRDVLVADASRRTTKSNAYVSGLGTTRRVVIWDTLLERAGTREVELVIAHELGHRREAHPAKLTVLLALGGIAGVLALWASIGTPTPRDLPAALVVFSGLELVGLPVLSAISRRFERAADRWSLELTDDLEAFERAHVGLARDNLSDLAPPRWAYALLFSHPTPPERLAFGRALAH